ncbi:melanoma cell adhesion molecule b isoform X2 [Antennarius striatus]|uniref:melanoma cell adhesion molecule b isoform X2 n=1 Tax=Antennarius striatus TaxID=241820 RepID=UPI0035AD8C13
MAGRDARSLLLGLLLVWGAWADVEVNMEDRVEVLRGYNAQIDCIFTSAQDTEGVVIQWLYVTPSGEKPSIYYQDATMNYTQQGTQFTDRISVIGTRPGEVVLMISNVQLIDELEFICLVKSQAEGAGEGRTRLKVFEIPDLPTIEGVQTGISVNEDRPSKIGICEVKNGYPKPNITWYRNNMPLRIDRDVVKITPSTTTESSGLFSVRSELSMKVEREHKDDLFYCEVTYLVPGETRMTETHRINVTVYYPSTTVNVWVESPKGKIKEGDSIELHCRGNGNTPSSLISITHMETGETWDNSMLVLSNVTRLNSGVYHCLSVDTDTFDEISGETKVFVNYIDDAVLKPEDNVVVPQGQDLTATCNALSSLQTHTIWLKDGEEISKDHSLMLKNVSFDTAGTYKCVVTVPEIEGMGTSGSLLVHIQGPPQIIKPDNTELEETFENTVDLSCNVRGFPAPSVSWTTSDGQTLKTASLRDTEEGVQSVVSVKVTSDISAVCNAQNDFGSDSLTFNIKAIKAETPIPPKKIKKESNGVIIAVIIICILLLAILGSVLYFLYKKGKICGRSGKQDLTKHKSSKDNIVVEMKSDNTEEAVLLGVNGEKQLPSEQ